VVAAGRGAPWEALPCFWKESTSCKQLEYAYT
jgi:hypothetical protein